MHADRTHAWFTVCVVSEFREERTMDPADFGGPRRHWYRNHTITHHGPLSMRVTTGQARSQTWEHWVQILSPCPCERSLERAARTGHAILHLRITNRPRRVRLGRTRCLWHYTRHYRRISTSRRIRHRCSSLPRASRTTTCTTRWAPPQTVGLGLSPSQRRPTIKCTRARRPRCLGSRRTSNSSHSSRNA